MKHALPRIQNRARLPITWHDAEYAVLRASVSVSASDGDIEDNFGDCVESDERAEVDSIVHGLERRTD